MSYNNQKHQWTFRAASIAGLAVEGVSLLREVRGSWFGIWPSEPQLTVFLIVDILVMVYVFRLTSRARESYIRAAIARETVWMTNDGMGVSLPRASGDGAPTSLPKEVESELIATIDCYRSVIKFLDESLMATFLDPDQLLQQKCEFQKSLDLLESANVALRSIRPDYLLRARLDLWETVDRIQSFERANAGHLKKALEVVQRSADGRRSG
jgi:hypothetical protein